jgi:hypothetical protein
MQAHARNVCPLLAVSAQADTHWYGTVVDDPCPWKVEGGRPCSSTLNRSDSEQHRTALLRQEPVMLFLQALRKEARFKLAIFVPGRWSSICETCKRAGWLASGPRL